MSACAAIRARTRPSTCWPVERRRVFRDGLCAHCGTSLIKVCPICARGGTAQQHSVRRLRSPLSSSLCDGVQSHLTPEAPSSVEQRGPPGVGPWLGRVSPDYRFASRGETFRRNVTKRHQRHRVRGLHHRLGWFVKIGHVPSGFDHDSGPRDALDAERSDRS